LLLLLLLLLLLAVVVRVVVLVGELMLLCVRSPLGPMFQILPFSTLLDYLTLHLRQRKLDGKLDVWHWVLLPFSQDVHGLGEPIKEFGDFGKIGRRYVGGAAGVQKAQEEEEKEQEDTTDDDGRRHHTHHLS